MRANLNAPKKINSQVQHDIKLDLDVRCQKLIERSLMNDFPETAVLGEEGVLGDQSATVRWVDCMERLLSMGCELFIELGPGGVLAGLLGRTRKGVDVMTVSDPDSVRACVERMHMGA